MFEIKGSDCRLKIKNTFLSRNVPIKISNLKICLGNTNCRVVFLLSSTVSLAKCEPQKMQYISLL